MVQTIISLVPSQTELLVDLGVGKRLVGVTKFCVHPADIRQTATVVGGTKQCDYAKIAALEPDLIIGNKEENERAGIEYLAARYRVWISDISNLSDALRMIRDVGALTGTAARAEALAAEIAAGFTALAPPAAPVSVAYFIWRQPYMVAASGTFIDDMLTRAGLHNVFADRARYPVVTAAELAAAAPARILLSSEPYPFRDKHLAEFRALCPAARVQLVDGELLSWYGSRLRLTPAYLAELRA